MDFIFLRDLELPITIGVQSWERANPQNIRLDLDIGLPSSHACLSDDVGDTIDYGIVISHLSAKLTAQEFHLVEAVADTVATTLLNDFGAPWVRVTVAKIGLFANVRLVGVTIERSQE